MDFIRDYWILILGVALMLFGYVWLILYPQLRENDVKNKYQSAAEPRILFQDSELEKGYSARFERERMRYMDAKNRWAMVQTPVIFFPMNTAFKIDWFGQTHHISTIGLSYTEYLFAGVRLYAKLRAIWDKEVYGQFGVKELMETKKQTPVDPDRLWQNSN